MKKMALLLLPLLARAIFAEEPPRPEPAAGAESSREIVLQVSTQPAAKLSFAWRFEFPFLRGEGPLTRGNGISVAPGAQITPVSASLTADAVWTPVAFAEISAGGRIGSGWNAALFGGEIRGIGLNLPGEGGAARHCGRAFDGAIWELRGGAALQGDLAAAFPGRWNHVIARTYHGIRFGAYTRAGRNEAWFSDNDEGENRNGFSYHGYLLVGYRMPLFLEMAALMAEADLFLTRMPGGCRWGDDRIRWTFSALLNFAATESLGITLAAQLRTRRNFEQDDWRDLHFTNRALDSSRPQRLEFFRAAAVMTRRF